MRAWSVAVFLGLAAATVRAGDLDDASFNLRLTAAISRFSRYPDVAGLGGTSAGSQWASSINPAGSGFNPAVGKKGWGLSLQYSGIFFKEGNDVHVFSESLAFDTEWGSWQPALTQLHSNEETTSDGLDFQWRAYAAELQWGYKLDDRTAIGLNFNFFDSEIEFGLGPVTVTESDSQTWGFRAGGLRKVSDRLFVGLALDYAFAPSTTTIFDVQGIGFGQIQDEDTTDQFIVRPGAYGFITDDLTFYFDYQFGYFADQDGALRVHRFYAGLDLTLREGVYLRGGTVIDTEGNVSAAVGLGLATSERVFFDFAYQYDMFPEVAPEFGRSSLFALSVTILF